MRIITRDSFPVSERDSTGNGSSITRKKSKPKKEKKIELINII